jgi:hypothetical protein
MTIALRPLLLALSLSFAAVASAADTQAVAPPVTRPADAEGWRTLTLRDLDAAHAVLSEHTPIPYDTENMAYRRWLDDGLAEARSRAAGVTDAAGHFYAISAYINGFRDPHIDTSPVGELPPARWPGFIVSARGQRAVVVHRDAADPDAPPLGATIERCDEQPLMALAEARVFPFVLNPALPADRRSAITRLFLDRGIPFAPPLLRCSLRSGDAVRDIALRWRPLPTPDSTFWAAYADAANGPAAPWGLSEPAPGVFWIGVPSFYPGEETAPKLQALVDAVTSRGDALRTAKAIVIDTRGNGGGSSAWADRLAEAVFTAPVLARAQARLPKRRTAVDWRSSPGNLAYWRAWVPELQRQLKASDWAQFEAMLRGLERAAKRQPPIWRSGPRKVDPAGGWSALRPRDQPAPFPARVYMLSNGSCVSACLDFADRVLMVPGVRLVGSSTSGDGPYMEVRDEALPSGLVRLTFPQKVYRGMKRAALENYEADIAYDGDWDDASVRAWTLGLVEAGR